MPPEAWQVLRTLTLVWTGQEAVSHGLQVGRVCLDCMLRLASAWHSVLIQQINPFVYNKADFLSQKSHAIYGIIRPQVLILILHVQVENATYVWLPLLPDEDGSGYTLQHADSWRPSDYRDQAWLPLVNDRTAQFANTGLSAAEQAWVDSLVAPRKKEQDGNKTVTIAPST